MTSKPVVLREVARRDVDGAIDFYLAEAGEAVALRFIDSLQAAIFAIGRHPAAGSPRYGQELDLPGLRTRRVARFPYAVFYVERDRDVDAWRVLHAGRDIPAWLGEP
ncbi:MAG: type II toxin-antitoxin system RelE/ParE family toxin [Caulobacterales bacterium]|jgi:toxin ParE1/3/4